MHRLYCILKPLILLWTISLLIACISCSDLQDSLPPGEESCAASQCHESTLLKQYPPESGKHTAHLFSGLVCSNCHFNYNENVLHKNGVKDAGNGEVIVFFNSKDIPLSWNRQITTCENNSCHIDADWYGSAVFQCTDCHSAPETGSHSRHYGDLSIYCTECHNDYRDDPSHTNGTLDDPDSSPGMISFGPLNTSGSYDNSTDTCSDLQCHGLGSPQWGSSAPCGTCHGNPPSTGAHSKHVAGSGLSCSECHLGRGSGTPFHADGTPDVNVATPVNPAGNYTPGASPGTGTCDSLYCHGSGTPSWDGSITCGSCHGIPPVTGAHSRHVTDMGYGCGKCHNGNNHADTTTDISFDGTNPSGSYAPGGTPGTGTCENLYCHGSGTPAWDGVITCTGCHGNPPLTGAHTKHVTDSGLSCNECHLERGSGTSYHANGNPDVNVTTAVNPSGNYTPGGSPGTGTCDSLYCHGSDTPSWDGTVSCGSCHGTPPATGAHSRHVTGMGYGCGTCHSGSVHGSTVVEVDFDATNPSGSYIPGGTPGTGTCNSLYCHGSGTPSWDGIITCDSCHGNPPLTGSHSKHVTDSGYTCSQCHFNRGNGTSYHVNGNSDINFDSAHSPGGQYAGGSCSDVYCHGNFIGGNNGTLQPVWGETVNCSTNRCHGDDLSGNPAASSSPDSKHGTHIPVIMNITNPSTGFPYTQQETCDVCHSGHGYGTSTHADRQVDVILDYTPPEGSPGNYVSGGQFNGSTGSFQDIVCADTYCHGNFAGGNTRTVNWGESTGDSGWCGSCHTTSPVSVKHPAHLALYPGECGYCHQGYTVSSVPSNHVSFVKNVNFGYPHSLSASSSYDNVTKTCTGVYCHGNFPQVTYTDRTGTTTLINPGNGDNPVWEDSSTAPCGSCHGDSDSNYSSLTHGWHTNATRIYAKSIFFGNTLSIESCDACHSYGDDTERSFGSASTQGSYNTINHADFSIDDAGINSDVNFKADDTDLASRIGTIVASKTTWDPGTTSCSNSWCHGNFSNGVDVTGFNGTPNWLNGTTGSCSTEPCHSFGIHGNYGCSGSCHGSSPYAEHVNGTIGF